MFDYVIRPSKKGSFFLPKHLRDLLDCDRHGALIATPNTEDGAQPTITLRQPLTAKDRALIKRKKQNG